MRGNHYEAVYRVDSMKEYSVIIIGGGPAGLFCALNCAREPGPVLVLEKKQNPGRKLLLTGSGQCNLTHSGPVNDFLEHYGGKANFVRPALFGFTGEALVDFFTRRNLPMIEDDRGKIFPRSLRAADVLGVLLSECRACRVEVRTGCAVTAATRQDGTFIVSAGTGSCSSRALVIAAGGASYPGTGSSGDGYVLARSLGHSIAEAAPALVPVYPEDYGFADCSGISLPGALVAHYRHGKKIGKTRGDVLFTHRGLSGPGILDYSRYVLPGDTLKVALAPCNSADDFDRLLIEQTSSQGKRTVKNILAGCGMPERVAGTVLALHDVPPDLRLSHLNRETRVRIAGLAAEYPFTVKRRGGFDEAMVTRGGVATGEINSRTMESRLVPGLFFAGEVMDVDGDTGGYNLQWAFSSAALAARSINSRPDVRSKDI
ncbi:MAG TPA: NAD(P)/FAD-dependent oxidoreductase [Spirochaetota bacterium]|nr:NAD(P)/FAD-dependent oxidoreductase [Spirochaetota bacterium]HPI90217.1 NAD(P)/FAD-dependent oxidoreductase [Spirochaetota bacterium]HPR46537.1 NAD(P)/FAD-dependent oxidoreductase [Spirochaetota bacterium]